MINLLPPDLKEQIHYAKLNRRALRYLRLTLLVAVVIGAVFGGALYLVGQQTAAVTADVASKQQTISELNATVLPPARAASDRLTAIKYIQGTQTDFSQVIADIASVLPQDVKIDTMSWTGDDQTPVVITMTAPSYNASLAVRDALTTSPRIADADIESITQTTGTNTWSLTVVIAFKPGEAG